MPFTQSTTVKAAQKKPKTNRYPFWSPRFWHGMRVGDWFRLLARNRFRVHPLRIPMAVLVTLLTCFNSMMAGLQELIYGRRISETEVEFPPVFIIGHWRSGTTFLHEMMVRDDRFAFPTTYECFAPSHFLVTGKILPRMFWFILPRRRPMDNMAVSWDRPQEDEFALCNLGIPSPMLRSAFPNDPPPYLEYLDMQVSSSELQHWKEAYLRFLKSLTLSKKKRLILKSPPHTGRIALLAEMFPGARFIHIVRDPFSLFPSTRRLWSSLDEAQGFQLPHNRQLDEFIFAAFDRMYRGFNQQRPLLAPAAIHDVRYEDLVADPLREVERIYERLELGDFEHVRTRMAEFVGEQKDYQANRHELEPRLRAELQRRWAAYFETYGYERETAPSPG